MNFRITTLFFGLLLTMLWVFGLMIAHKKAAGDQTLIMPSLGERDVKIDKVYVKRVGKESFEAELVFENGFWFLKNSPSKQKARVEGHRVDSIVKLIQTAKHDETTDVNKSPAVYGLDKPSVEVTLEGTTKTEGERKKWKFIVGDDKARAGMAYVQASERGEQIFAVARKSLDPLFFKDPNSLRSRRLFDFGETGVTKIEAKKDGAPSPLEIERIDPTHWTFLKPKLGPAGAESEPAEEKKKDMFHKEAPPAPASGGVKGLLNSISTIQVDDEDDFEALGSSLDKYGLEPGKEWMRIEITSKNEKNEDTKEILYVGKEVVPARKGNYRYAKLDSDDGVFQIAGQRLDPIAKAIDEPGKLRSQDIAAYKKDLVDAVVIQQGKNDVKFFKSEVPSKPADFMKPNAEIGWQMVAAGEKKKASDSMVNALLDQVLGKKAIVEFAKGTEEEQKKEEVKWGFAEPDVKIISIYINGIDKDKKEERKDNKDKKDEKKDETKKNPLPELKKDQKPEVTLTIGKIEGDFMHIRRTLKDGSVSRFTVKKDFTEKLVPAEGVELAYLDLALPQFSLDDAVAIKLHRVTDKGPSTVELVRRFVDGATLWFIKDANEPTGSKLAETHRVSMLFAQIQRPDVNKKWLKKLDNNENLDKYGLTNPAATLTITVKKNIVNANTAAAVVGVLAGDGSAFAALEAAVLGYEADPGELMTFAFGKDTEDSKDKPGVFAKHSGSPLLFLAPTDLVKAFKDIDMRDRSSMLYAPVSMTLAAATAALVPANAWMLASPYFTGVIHQIDPETVTKVKLSVLTPIEFRSFEFIRKEKEKAKDDKAKAPDDKVKEKAKDDKAKAPDDKAKDLAKDEKDKDKESKWTWIDNSGLRKFEVAPEKVAKLVKDFAKLPNDRFVAFGGSPRADYKLDPDEATIKLDFTTADGKTVTLLVGASFQQPPGIRPDSGKPVNGYFARSSAWPEVVFFVERSIVEPILEGAPYFAKPRAVAE